MMNVSLGSDVLIAGCVDFLIIMALTLFGLGGAQVKP